MASGAKKSGGKRPGVGGQRRGKAPPKRSAWGWLKANPAYPLVAGCAVLVLVNNVGALPQPLHRTLHLRLDQTLERWHAQPRVRRPVTPVAEPEPQAVVDPAPVPAVDPPRELVEPSRTAVTSAQRPAVRPPVEPAKPARVDDPVARRHTLLDGVVTPLGFTAEWGGGTAELSLAANEVVRGPSGRRRVALTFDAHVKSGHLDWLLERLQAQHAKVTFFVSGTFAQAHPETVKRMAKAGHEVANLTANYARLTSLPDDAVRREAEQAERLLRPLAGERYRPYVRPPYGERNVRVLRALLGHGFLPVGASVDLAADEAQPVAGDICQGNAAAAVTVERVASLIAGLRQSGLEPGTLSELLR